MPKKRKSLTRKSVKKYTPRSGFMAALAAFVILFFGSLYFAYTYGTGPLARFVSAPTSINRIIEDSGNTSPTVSTSTSTPTGKYCDDKVEAACKKDSKTCIKTLTGGRCGRITTTTTTPDSDSSSSQSPTSCPVGNVTVKPGTWVATGYGWSDGGRCTGSSCSGTTQRECVYIDSSCKQGATKACNDAYASDPKNTVLPVSAGDQYTGGAKVWNPCTTGGYNVPTGNASADGKTYCLNGYWVANDTTLQTTANGLCDTDKKETYDLVTLTCVVQTTTTTHTTPVVTNPVTSTVTAPLNCSDGQVIRKDTSSNKDICKTLTCDKGCLTTESCIKTQYGSFCQRNSTLSTSSSISQCSGNVLEKWDGKSWSKTYCSTGCDEGKKACNAPPSIIVVEPTQVQTNNSNSYDSNNTKNVGKECDDNSSSTDKAGKYTSIPSCSQVCPRNTDGSYKAKSVGGKLICDNPPSTSNNYRTNSNSSESTSGISIDNTSDIGLNSENLFVGVSRSVDTNLDQTYAIDLETDIFMQNGAFKNISIKNVDYNIKYDTTLNTSGCGPSALLNALKLIDKAPYADDAKNIDDILHNSNFYISCTANGCASGADSIMAVLQNKYNITNAYNNMQQNKVSEANDLANASGLFVYQGDVSDPTVKLKYGNTFGHNALIVCKSGNCESIDSYTGEGHPQPCEVVDKNNLKCGTSTYSFSTSSNSVGVQSGAYLIPGTETLGESQ